MMSPRHPDPSKAYRGVDRYSADELRRATDLGQRPFERPDHDQVDIVSIAVLDPRQDAHRKAGQTSRASANCRVDILEYERRHGRLTPGAYQIGRVVQHVFEQSHLGGTSNWSAGSRIDSSRAKELAIIRKLTTARTIRAHLIWIRRVVGERDAEILRQILCENRRYGDVQMRHVFQFPRILEDVELAAKVGVKGTAYIARRFRDALDTLATTRIQPPEVR